MTSADLAWRTAGAALIAASAAGAALFDGSAVAALWLPIALAGLTLAVSGKRVRVALRAERRGHHHTARAIHAGRVRRCRR